MEPAAPWLTRRCAWIDHSDELPVIDGTIIRLTVQRLHSGGGEHAGLAVVVRCGRQPAPGHQVDHCWQAFLRRFDIEHTFRLLKQTPGWPRPRPRLRQPEAADRWTWLLLAVHAQLRLTRPLAADLRHPWERPARPSQADSSPGPACLFGVELGSCRWVVVR